MSSAQDEADDGPIHDDSEEESRNDNLVLDIADIPSHGRKDLTAGSHEAKNEVEVEEDKESVTASSDHTPLKNGTHLSDQGTSIPPVSRDSTPEIGRPSSADGSLSIPDDTPSVQVGKTCTISYPAHPFYHRVHWPRPLPDAPLPLPMDAVLHPHYDRSTADSKLAFLRLPYHRRGPHLQHSSMYTPVNHLRPSLSKISEAQTLRKHHGMLLGGQSSEESQVKRSLRSARETLGALHVSLFLRR